MWSRVNCTLFELWYCVKTQIKNYDRKEKSFDQKKELILIIAKQRWRNLCVIAIMITILYFPLDFNLSEKYFKIGVWFLAITAGKYRTLRNSENLI